MIPIRSGRIPCIRIMTMGTDVGGRSSVEADRKIRSIRLPITTNRTRSELIGAGADRWIVTLICADKNRGEGATL